MKEVKDFNPMYSRGSTIYIVPTDEAKERGFVPFPGNNMASTLDCYCDATDAIEEMKDGGLFNHFSGFNYELQDLTLKTSLGFRAYSPIHAEAFFIYPRSSSGVLEKNNVLSQNGHLKNVYQKASISLANTVGVIDHDYRGEVFAMVNLNGKFEDASLDHEKFLTSLFHTKPRVQAVAPQGYQFKIVDSIDEIDDPATDLTTERGEGGFGSTDKD